MDDRFTTAGSSMNGTKLAKSVVVSLALACTSDVSAATPRSLPQADMTGPSVNRLHSALDHSSHQLAPSKAVLEIRKQADLTWKELANLFAVSRRSVHNWAADEPITSENEHRIYSVLDLIRQIHDRVPAAVRHALLMPRPGGVSIFDLVKEGAINEALEVIETIEIDAERGMTPLSEASLPADRPNAMDLLDRVEETSAPEYKVRGSIEIRKRG